MMKSAGLNLRFASCAICGAAITVHQSVLGGVCENADCRKRKLVQDVARRREQSERDLRERVTRVCLEGVVRIPLRSNESVPRPLSGDRRKAFGLHLAALARRVIEEATPTEETVSRVEGEEADRPSPATEVLARVCAFCRGACCVRGGEMHAFLNDDTLRRFLRHNPESTAADIVEVYMGHVGDETYEDSCVYHSPSGCTLPRGMRSDVCNTFFCNELVRLNREMGDAWNRPVFVAAVSNGDIGRTAWFNVD